MKTSFLCLLVTFSAAAGATLPPLDRDEAARLNRNIDDFYHGRTKGATTWGVMQEQEFCGAAVMTIVLGHVVRHARDPYPIDKRRSLELLSWAVDLAHAGGDAPVPFVSRLLRKQLNFLHREFRDDLDRREAVYALFEATHMWGPRQIRYLAERAGDANPVVARYYADILYAMTPWSDDDTRALAGVIRRRPPGRRSPEQWGLLALSNRATVNEYAYVLRLAATSFASWDPENTWLDDDHPIREAVEELQVEYDAGEEFAIEVFTRAWESSEHDENALEQRPERRRFLNEFHDYQRYAPDQEAAPVKPKRASRPKAAREFRSRFPHRGNVFYPKFGHCESSLSGSGEG